ncbi:MAG: hypothetical protein Q9191_002657 [Dirinaria sp. TL-2023a]
MPPPSPLPTNVYKILAEAPLSPLPKALPLDPLDARDGYIHFSTAEQVSATASRFFSHVEALWLLKIPLDPIEDKVKWEESKSGCFAHLYGADLGQDEIVATRQFSRKYGESWEQVLADEKWLE